jgi:hypothetical protein
MENQESIVYPVVRHILQFVGGGAIFTGDELTMIAGVIASAGAVAWGICKRKGYRVCS